MGADHALAFERSACSRQGHKCSSGVVRATAERLQGSRIVPTLDSFTRPCVATRRVFEFDLATEGTPVLPAKLRRVCRSLPRAGGWQFEHPDLAAVLTIHADGASATALRLAAESGSPFKPTGLPDDEVSFAFLDEVVGPTARSVRSAGRRTRGSEAIPRRRNGAAPVALAAAAKTDAEDAVPPCMPRSDRRRGRAADHIIRGERVMLDADLATPVRGRDWLSQSGRAAQSHPFPC